MTELSLQGAVDDGATLVLADGSGEQFTLPIDDELFAAVRRDRARRAGGPAPGEPLRPRDIQAMVRSGMTAEEIAETTGADLEHVRTYEHPVLAERRHTAERAGRCLVYPQNDLDDAPRPLAQLAAERLALREVDLDSMKWDAWKSQGGAWHVELSFTAASSRRTAAWEYRHNSVRPLDDEARWLSDAGPTDSGPIPNFGSGTERVFNIEAENRRSEQRAARGAQRTAAPAPGEAPGAPAGGAAHRDQAAETGRILEGLRRRRGRPDDTQAPREQPPGLHSVAEEPPTHPDGAHTALSRPQDAKDDGVFPLPRSADDEAQAWGAESEALADAPLHPDAQESAAHDPGTQEQGAQAAHSPAGQRTSYDTEPIAPGVLFDDAATPDQPSLLDEPGVTDGAPENEAGGGPSEPLRASDAKDPGEQQSKRRGGRTSLPSWDEIMFGSKRD